MVSTDVVSTHDISDCCDTEVLAATGVERKKTTNFFSTVVLVVVVDSK